jgi:hypothetical protein
MAESPSQQLRSARNQALFREVNARLLDLNETFDRIAETAVFVCECAQMTCIEQIEMTLDEYERVRRNQHRFFVAASEDHVVPAIEIVVERHPGYFVVEKVGAGAEAVDGVTER